MPSNTSPKTVLLKGDPSYIEYAAAAAITPGHMCYLTSAGKLAVHNVAGGTGVLPSAKIFALENELVGKGIDDAYATNDQVIAANCKPGDEVYAWLKNGVTTAIGSGLESDGAGALQLSTHAVTSATTAAATPVAVALEVVNNSGGGTGPGSAMRVKVRIL